MEQTSSTAYPNILVVDYVKKARVASPEILMKAEQYLNVGYQKLLTFERPGGGFDWWGSGEPLVWLSAYGLQEFSDMARVYPIDRGVLDRTQRWLMKQREADGTWSKIGATHGVTLEHVGLAAVDDEVTVVGRQRGVDSFQVLHDVLAHPDVVQDADRVSSLEC